MLPMDGGVWSASTLPTDAGAGAASVVTADAVVLASGPESLQPGTLVPTDAGPFLPQIRDLFNEPDGGKYHVEVVGGGARKLLLGSDELGIVILPFRVIFDSFTNRYCGLAAFRAGATKPMELPLLVGEYDPCIGIRKIAEVDLNHDGWPDFIFELTARSRGWRSPARDFSEAAVFLSVRREMTYCYAPKASGAVTARGIYAAAASVRAVEEQARRRGEEKVFICGQPEGP
jgi:hypothetical protein